MKFKKELVAAAFLSTFLSACLKTEATPVTAEVGPVAMKVATQSGGIETSGFEIKALAPKDAGSVKFEYKSDRAVKMRLMSSQFVVTGCDHGKVKNTLYWYEGANVDAYSILRAGDIFTAEAGKSYTMVAGFEGLTGCASLSFSMDIAKIGNLVAPAEWDLRSDARLIGNWTHIAADGRRVILYVRPNSDVNWVEVNGPQLVCDKTFNFATSSRQTPSYLKSPGNTLLCSYTLKDERKLSLYCESPDSQWSCTLPKDAEFTKD